MNDTPKWLRRLMERDPRAEDPAPLDDLTAHRMTNYMREIGRQEAAHEERMLASLLVGMEDAAKVVELAEQLERD